MTRSFEGHAGRECGEHRTTGGRAWCHGCSEWCYPDSPCKGCELPQLRNILRTLLDAIEQTMGPYPGGPIEAAADEARALLDDGQP